MKLKFKNNKLVVTNEKGDNRYFTESGLLYAIKNTLNKQGYNLIKKRMWKDGHMMDDIQQYLRTRKKGAGKADIYVYDSLYSIRNLSKDYNMTGEIELTVVYDVFNPST